MDFSGFLVIPLAAVITACWIVVAALLSKRSSRFHGSFLLAYGLGVIFMQPWLISSWQDAGMIGLMLLVLVLWVAGGCLIGAIPGMLIVALGSKVRRTYTGRIDAKPSKVASWARSHS
jgi:hypothetical protein